MRALVASSLLSLTYFTCIVAEEQKPQDPVLIESTDLDSLSSIDLTPPEFFAIEPNLSYSDIATESAKPAIAAETPNSMRAPTEPVLKPKEDKKNCSPGPGSRASIGYRGPKGFGYDHGYATLSTFISPSGMRLIQPFIDLRGHVFNDGRWAANAGLGGRIDCDKVVVGLNAYYDYRDTEKLGSQSQVGGGFELLSKWADLRINGYAPIGDTTGKDCPCFDHFACHSAFANQVVRASLADIDAEIGFYIPKVKPVDLYFAIGPYYLFEKRVSNATLGGAWGGRARVSLKVYDGITLGGDITYDPIFNTKAQGWATLSFPFGPANLLQNGSRFQEKYPAPCDETARQFARMTQPVYRNEIIPVQSKTRIYDILCECCSPSKFLFVNNCKGNKGCGTFENPYNNLFAAESASRNGDIIYVFPGDGTSKGMDCGFIMKDCQRLLSSAVCFDLCNICVPACTPGYLPLIENSKRTTKKLTLTVASAVTMKNCTELAGFQIDGSNRPANAATTSGVDAVAATNYTIRENVIKNFEFGVVGPFEAPLSNDKVSINNNCFSNLVIGLEFPVGMVNTNFTCNDNAFLDFNNINTLFKSATTGMTIASVENSALSINNNLFKNFTTVSDDQDVVVAGIAIYNGESTLLPLTNSTLCCNNNCFINFNGTANNDPMNGQNVTLGGILSGLITNSSISSSNSTFQNFNASGNTTLVGGFGSDSLTPHVNNSFNFTNNTFTNFQSSGTNPASNLISTATGITLLSLQNSSFNSCNNSLSNFTASNANGEAGVFGIAVANRAISTTFNICNNSLNNFNATGGTGANGRSLITGLAIGSAQPSSFLTANCCNNSFSNFNASEGPSQSTIIGISNRSPVANSTLNYCNNSFTDFTASNSAGTTVRAISATGTATGPLTANFSNNSFQNLNSVNGSNNAIFISSLRLGSATICNNSFDLLQASATPIDVFLLSSPSLNQANTFCVENNSFFSQILLSKSNTGTSCLRLTNNTNMGTYLLTEDAGTLNIESPDLNNLEAGLSSINTGTFNIVGTPTPVPVGACGCTGCCTPISCNKCN